MNPHSNPYLSNITAFISTNTHKKEQKKPGETRFQKKIVNFNVALLGFPLKKLGIRQALRGTRVVLWIV